MIRLGARRSPLARAQVDIVEARLAAAGVETAFVGVTTTGDVDRRELTEIGGTGVFAGAVRDALRHGTVDVAVHSLKDLPTLPEPDLELVAVPGREDTRDVLVGRRLADLAGRARDRPARIGTGAPRRALQLQQWAADAGVRIDVVPVRGNVETRINLARTGVVDAVVLAAAGLHRLGYLQFPDDLGPDDAAPVTLHDLPAEVLPLSVMLPAPGQGALALEVSRDLAAALREPLAALDDAAARTEVVAERAFLARLEAGCTAPVGARARAVGVRGTSADLTLAAVVGRTLSSTSVERDSWPALRLTARGSSRSPETLGAQLAERALTDLSPASQAPNSGGHENRTHN